MRFAQKPNKYSFKGMWDNPVEIFKISIGCAIINALLCWILYSSVNGRFETTSASIFKGLMWPTQHFRTQGAHDINCHPFTEFTQKLSLVLRQKIVPKISDSTIF